MGYICKLGGGGANLESKTITDNGTYNAETDDLDGYNTVTVNVKKGYFEAGGSFNLDSNARGSVNIGAGRKIRSAIIYLIGTIGSQYLSYNNGSSNPLFPRFGFQQAGYDGGYFDITVSGSGTNILTVAVTTTEGEPNPWARNGTVRYTIYYSV